MRTTIGQCVADLDLLAHVLEPEEKQVATSAASPRLDHRKSRPGRCTILWLCAGEQCVGVSVGIKNWSHASLAQRAWPWESGS